LLATIAAGANVPCSPALNRHAAGKTAGRVAAGLALGAVELTDADGRQAAAAATAQAALSIVLHAIWWVTRVIDIARAPLSIGNATNACLHSRVPDNLAARSPPPTVNARRSHAAAIVAPIIPAVTRQA
jgi:hypothetical protein